MDWGHHGMMGGFGIIGVVFGLLLVLAFFVATIFLLVWLARQFSTGAEEKPQRRSRAVEILEERYAKGEIDKEEFNEMKKEIGP